MSSLKSMTDAEEQVCMIIVNDKEMNSKIGSADAMNGKKAMIFMVDLINTEKIRPQINSEYSYIPLRYSLIYLHVLENQDNLFYADLNLLAKWSVPSPLKHPAPKANRREPKIGDNVTHTGCHKTGLIIGEDRKHSDVARWKVKYDDSGKEGSWLKKYTIITDKNAQMSGANAIIIPDEETLIRSQDPAYKNTIIDYDTLGKSIMYMMNYGASNIDIINKIESITNITREFSPPVNNALQPEKTMQAELEVTKVNDKIVSTKLNGQETSTLQSNQLIRYIQKAETEIVGLEKIKVESKAVKKEIKRLNKFIKDVVVILDNK